MNEPFTLSIVLPAEHARLYHTSAFFKNGVDTLLQGIVPATLDGFAAKAEQLDADLQARTRAAMGGYATVEGGPA